MAKCYLSGDIGGTKTLLRVQAGDAVLLQQSYPSAEYAGLEDILAVFLREAGHPTVDAACLAIAGPVFGRQVQLTNLPWVVDADALAARFGFRALELINDFAAVGHGVAVLTPADMLTLQGGEPEPQGIRVVLGAGTGLGVAWMSWQGDGYAVHGSEGGHIDFAPADELQYALLRYLQQRYGHVSYERIVSGPGIVAVYEFLRDSGRGVPSAALAAAIDSGEGAAAITRFAGLGEAIAGRTLELFVDTYGAFAGNLALIALPRGGLYIAGGIAAKMAERIQDGRFLQAFQAKGRYEGLMQRIPIHLVTNPHIGLLGAAAVAVRLGAV
jgi:glucokinase